MKMSEIYGALEIEKKSAKVIFDCLMKEKTDLEEQILKLEESLENIIPRFERAKGNVEAIAKSMEALETLGNFRPGPEEEAKEEAFKKEMASEEAEKAAEAMKAEDSDWKKKRNAKIVKYGMDGKKLGSYQNQGQLAKQLNISSKTVSYYMKQDENTQLARRGFYLKWEY